MACGEEDFEPAELTSAASLNTVRIGDHRGLPAELVGKRAGEVCSRDGLIELAAEEGLAAHVRPERVTDDLSAIATSAHAEGRRAVRNVLHRFGSRVGALIATLSDPATADAQGSSPARRAYLTYWASLRRTWLGGGLVSPTTAGSVLAGVHAVLGDVGVDVAVEVLPHAQLAPLLGAARRAPITPGRTLVSDLGHSSIKTAVAVHGEGSLRALEGVRVLAGPSSREPGKVEEVVLDALGEAMSRERAIGRPAGTVIASVASYVSDGIPIDDSRSAYGKLGQSMGRIEATLSKLAGRDVMLRCVHDGTASAAACPDQSPAAVITLGSWLGIGFVPARGSLLEVASEFEVRTADWRPA